MNLQNYYHLLRTSDDQINKAANLAISIASEFFGGRVNRYEDLLKAAAELRQKTLTSDLEPGLKQDVESLSTYLGSIKPPDRGTSGTAGGRPVPSGDSSD